MLNVSWDVSSGADFAGIGSLLACRDWYSRQVFLLAGWKPSTHTIYGVFGGCKTLPVVCCA